MEDVLLGRYAFLCLATTTNHRSLPYWLVLINLWFSLSHCWLNHIASVILPKLLIGKGATVSGWGFADRCIVYLLPLVWEHHRMPQTPLFFTEYSNCQRSALSSAQSCPPFPLPFFTLSKSVCLCTLTEV